MSTYESLESLAQLEFGKLHVGESKLLRSTPRGEVLEFDPRILPDNQIGTFAPIWFVGCAKIQPHVGWSDQPGYKFPVGEY